MTPDQLRSVMLYSPRTDSVDEYLLEKFPGYKHPKEELTIFSVSSWSRDDAGRYHISTGSIMRQIARAIAMLLAIFLLMFYSRLSFSAPTDLARGEISSIDFEGLWLPTSAITFPKDAINAFPEYAKREKANSPLQFVWVNLDGEGENEIIVASPLASRTGGTSYFILRKVKGVWLLIAEFQGGITLSFEEGNFYQIISYYRKDGETYQHTYNYANGLYKRISAIRMPGLVSHSCWWQILWSRLNSYGNDPREIAHCDQLIVDKKRANPPSASELTMFDFRDRWLGIYDSSFPKAAIKAFPKDLRSDVEHKVAHLQVNFVAIDLVGDKENELIINIPTYGGSGGNYYLVLKKAGNTWRPIGRFLGGLVLSLEDGPRSSSSYRITSFYRSGETYPKTYEYSNGNYRLINEAKLPRVIDRSCWWMSFWSRLESHRDTAGSNAAESKKRWNACSVYE